MAKMELTCEFCKNKCKMEVEYEGKETSNVSGNGCMRGMLYAQQRVATADEKDK